MGIRLHKNIGFGLDISGLDKTVLHGIWEHDAPKFDGPLHAEFLEEAKKHTNLSFAHERILMKRFKESIPFENFVVYQDEFGLSDKLLLQPYLSGKSWSRSDDDIDYYTLMSEFEDWNNALTNSWKEIKGCFYPLIGLMRAKEGAPYGYETFWDSCYLDDPELQNSIPQVPFHLWFILRELKLAAPEKTTELFLKLRPTAYRYWA